MTWTALASALNEMDGDDAEGLTNQQLQDIIDACDRIRTICNNLKMPGGG